MFLNTNPPLLLWQIKMISYQKMFTSCTQNFQNCWSYMDQIVYTCFCLTWTRLYMPVFVLHGPDCICLFLSYMDQIVYACFCLTLSDCICLFLSYSTRLYMPVFVLLYQIVYACFCLTLSDIPMCTSCIHYNHNVGT